ncbi:hypothetical protein [Cryobacterium sp. PAMC25264]|uniref:hypothetical protein n=1 Tax=Cryobacterium sp. PAMC25264 TaxID=2861288 RepID=UPI001C63560F|nr:hypothetical protein [Cryobacterium sp. PAMC25264]QYF73782.1 hypothetical protein KY500_00390 [Cryobacterium sp. PAMC25264]
MNDQNTNHQQTNRSTPEAAARLLQASDAVSDRVREAIDARTQAIIDAWMALAVVTYALAFALTGFSGASGTNLIPGVYDRGRDAMDLGSLVLSGIFALSTLTGGLSDSLRRPTRRGAKRYRAGYIAGCLLPFAAMAYLTFLAPGTPWSATLALAVASTVPVIVVALRSAGRARAAGVRRSEPTLSGLLDPTGRALTAALGIGLGGIGVLTGPSFGLAGTIAACAFLLFLIASHTTRVDLDQIAKDWGPAQWTALGYSYTLTLVLSVVLSRTSWNLDAVSVVGGLLIAAPLVVAAFRPAPIWEV